MPQARATYPDRKSTRLNSSHTVIYTLSLHDALPIYVDIGHDVFSVMGAGFSFLSPRIVRLPYAASSRNVSRSEEHTSELQSHSDLHSFPTRRSSDLC